MQRNIKTNNLPRCGAYLLCKGVYARWPNVFVCLQYFWQVRIALFIMLSLQDAYKEEEFQQALPCAGSNEERTEKTAAKIIFINK